MSDRRANADNRADRGPDLTGPASAPRPPRGIKGKYVVLAIGLVAMSAAVVSIKLGRHYYLPKRFYEVEAGQLYRSGYIEPTPLRRIIDDKRIKTILCLLNDEPEDSDQKKEAAVVREKGIHFIRIGMPGDGLGRFEDLDRAADAIAAESNRPILVHCAGGENRTGAAYAAYRMKYCGWTFERALNEGDNFGLPIRENAELVVHLKAYRDHLAAAGQSATQSTTEH